MRPRDREEAENLSRRLASFGEQVRPLPGIAEVAARDTLIEQLLESIHRVEFVRVLQNRDVAEERADPNKETFDPLKAAILHHRRGNSEEACWTVFLFVHFGKHRRGGWR